VVPLVTFSQICHAMEIQLLDSQQLLQRVSLQTQMHQMSLLIIICISKI